MGDLKVLVALSGGMDSAFAAALLKEAGWEVRAVHFEMPAPRPVIEARREAASRIARFLEIPLEVVALKGLFRRVVIEPFIESYVQGLTPNPCVVCNARIKFEGLIRCADEQGIPWIATGHYARVNREGPRIQLHRGKDPRKEQSYFLHRLRLEQLNRVLFPLGDLTKADVRSLGQELGLLHLTSTESQEVCFLAGGDYRAIIEKEGRGGPCQRPGNIINNQGDLLGHHRGFHRYTIGQRQGLGIASSRPYYVREIRAATHEVVVGRKEEIYGSRVEAMDFHWIEGSPPVVITECMAQVRYRHPAAPGRLEPLSETEVLFTFNDAQWAIAPGQALVCYEGTRVLGGGWIKGVTSRE